MAPSNDSSPIDATTRLVDTDRTTLITPPPPAHSGESFMPGDTIDRRYRVERVYGGTGKSGMGVVYIASTGGRTVALKSIQRRFAKDLGIVERFLREARSWMLLGFLPHVVHAYRIDIIDATPFLFLEYIQPNDRGAVSLADHLKHGALPVERAMRLAIQCAEGMKRATETLPELVHRDLKPENLLVTRHDTLKVTDFGLVRTALTLESSLDANAIADAGMTAMAGGALGTPAYMAPEQFDSADRVSVAADIYAFGCCFYETIAGRRVFSVEGKSGLQALLEFREQHRSRNPVPLRDHASDCPEALEALLARCLAKDPNERWPDWPTLHAALLAIYERHCGACYVGVPAPEPSAMEVAVQVQSLTLLDGYRHAVQLRNLREQHDISPYPFHLALASYFHCHDEAEEAHRQLERAVRIKGEHDGYEAVGRLAAYYIEDGELNDAEALITDYLLKHPDGHDRILEAYVRVRIARGDADGVIPMLRLQDDSWRVRSLLAEALKAAGRTAEFGTLLADELTKTLDVLKQFIADVEDGADPAWARESDPELLCNVLAELDGALETSAIARASHTCWPDLDGYPDFAAPMARLSWLLGELAALDGTTEPEPYAALAQQLDYPERMREFLERDERWLWQRN